MSSEQRKALEAERARLEQERTVAVAEVNRVRQEMEAVQHELMLASELSSVNGTLNMKIWMNLIVWNSFFLSLANWFHNIIDSGSRDFYC